MNKVLQDRMLSHNELANFLGVSRSTLHRYRSTAQVPEAIYIAGRPRWRLAEVKCWIDSGAPPLRKWKYDARREQR